MDYSDWIVKNCRECKKFWSCEEILKNAMTAEDEKENKCQEKEQIK